MDFQPWFSQILDYLFSWQIVVLFLVLFFHNDIRRLLGRLRKVVRNGLGIEFDPDKVAELEKSGEQIAKAEIIQLKGEVHGTSDVSGTLTVTPDEPDEPDEAEEPDEPDKPDKPPPLIVSVEDTVSVSESLSLSVKSGIDWEKVGSLFWLGNDLMWVNGMMYRGVKPEKVLEGVEKAIQYSSELGFGEKSFPIQQLSLSRTILDSLTNVYDWDEQKIILLQQHYKTVIQYVNSVKFYITALAEEKQPGFEKL